jgi:hypothetical protein
MEITPEEMSLLCCAVSFYDFVSSRATETEKEAAKKLYQKLLNEAAAWINDKNEALTIERKV